ncbi:TIM21 protein, partial [Oesophagostomum dentatum]
MTSALLLRLSTTGRSHVFYLTRIAYSSRGGNLFDTSYCRHVFGFRHFSDKTGKTTRETTKLAEKKEEKQTGLQRSILEEVLIKEKQKPTTFTGKVAEKASNTFLYAAVAAAVGMLGVFVYLLAGEFFAEDSPQKIYSSALALVREDGRCQDLFGPKIAGFGEETSRGRRRHVAHHKYEKDGRQRIRVLFHLKMEDDGFKVVRSRKGKSRLKKLGYEPAQRIAGSLEDIRQVISKADSQIKESGLSSWIITKLKCIVKSRRLSHIYVVGNGHFDASWEPGAHQLALVREICREFRAEIIFQEPCLSSAEREWLCEQERTTVRDASDVSLEDLVEGSDNVQLVVLIHGLHSLLNDLKEEGAESDFSAITNF